MGLFGLIKKKLHAHKSGDTRCAECPDHWPIEHQNCGGLLHSNSKIKSGGTKRYVVCDKCGQGAELGLIGKIGSDKFPAEAVRQLERQTLADATGGRRSSGVYTQPRKE